MIQETTDYQRIEKAINYIREHFKLQPDLETIAAHVGLSSFHFQRLFTEWAGISPKKFLQFTTVSYAKKLLKENKATLVDTAYDTGLSGIGRLHDLFVTIEGMTPGEYKNGGEFLLINYSFIESPFGKLILASTQKGICYIAFLTEEEKEEAFVKLKAQFPKAYYKQRTDEFQQQILPFFQADRTELKKVKLHLKGTPFQLKVWETLLKIPSGNLTTYGDIAKQLGNPRASRAVGTAIGDNPAAFVIPCHRVIQGNGTLGGYHWGLTRKTILIGWEAAQQGSETNVENGSI